MTRNVAERIPRSNLKNIEFFECLNIRTLLLRISALWRLQAYFVRDSNSASLISPGKSSGIAKCAIHSGSVMAFSDVRGWSISPMSRQAKIENFKSRHDFKAMQPDELSKI